MPKCGVCQKDFATDVALAQHLKDKHGDAQGQPTGPGSGGTTIPAKSRSKSLRRRNRHPVAIGILAVALATGVGLYIVVAPQFYNPFPFTCLPVEASFFHIHPYLRIQVENKNVTIPGLVGLKPGCTQPVHTHDESGIIHIEAPALVNYTLGDFFKIWKASFGTVSFNGTSRPVEFNSTSILGYQADSSHRVILLVDGTESTLGAALNLLKLDYCSSTSTNPICGSAPGDPNWNNGLSAYPYGTGHTIVIEYVQS